MSMRPTSANADSAGTVNTAGARPPADAVPVPPVETPPIEAAAEDTGAGVTEPALSDTFIAVPQSRLVEALATLSDQTDPTRHAAFDEVRRLMGLLFRIEGRDVLAALRDDYHDFNPDLPLAPATDSDSAARDATYRRLLDRLEHLLTQANFARVDPDSLVHAERAAAEVDAEVSVPRHHYADVAFFARGRRRATTSKRWLMGLIQKDIPSVRLRHVVVLIRFHDTIETPRRKLPIQVGPPRPTRRVFEGKTVIKLFTDVAEADLNMLYPGARAVMKVRDKLLLGVPALAGGVPILMNILPALTVLFVVAAAYLGLTAEGDVPQQDMAKALAAMSALAGLGGFLMRQWIKFERQVLKYQMILTDNLYFRNVCNNAAVFDYLLGTAEDQEFKEALLAYTHLDAAKAPMPVETLKDAVDGWLEARFGVHVSFDIDDALDKLRRLNLLIEAGDGSLSVRPLPEALSCLRARWHQVAGDMPDPMPERGSTESAGLEAADGR